MNKLAAIISLSLAVTSTAAVSDVYVGGKIGVSWLDDACLSGGVCDEKTSNPTLGAYLGYQANDWLSLELGYDYLDKFTGAGLNDERVDAITLAPRVSLPVSEALALYVKAGGAYVDYGSKDDFSYLGAAGIEWLADDNVSLRLEYQAITDINNDIVRAMANTVTLGLSYKFGSSKTDPVPVAVEPVAPDVIEVAEPEVTVVTKSYPDQHLSGNNFAHNSAEISSQAAKQLDELATFLNANPQAKVEITGHTDSLGSAEYNQAMSEKRAIAVADVLFKNGIDESRMIISGQGESNPIASNETKEGRQQNRRVDIVVPAFEYQVEE
ncbi:MAG: OmpA family protein [Vibrio sp.]|uniref:OmpA family protein n=1 Tax=Vibrio sp. TaxID=678 RepID=UPI003A8A54B9